MFHHPRLPSALHNPHPHARCETKVILPEPRPWPSHKLKERSIKGPFPTLGLSLSQVTKPMVVSSSFGSRATTKEGEVCFWVCSRYCLRTIKAGLKKGRRGSDFSCQVDDNFRGEGKGFFDAKRGKDERTEWSGRGDRKHRKWNGVFCFEKVEEVGHCAKCSVVGVVVLGRLLWTHS